MHQGADSHFLSRAASLAVMNMVGQAFSIAGSRVFDSPPTYLKGKIFALALSLVGILVASCLMLYLKWQNAKKRREQFTDAVQEKRQMSLEDIFEQHPDFFYW